MRHYEIWVHYVGEYAHLNDHAVGDQGRFWFRRNAEERANSLNAMHKGLRSIGRREPCMEFFVRDDRDN